MGKREAKPELMPADHFLYKLNLIEEKSELYYSLLEERRVNEYEQIKKRLLDGITMIERDIQNSVNRAWSSKTGYFIAKEFYNYSSEIYYFIYHARNHSQFIYYLKKFKESAIKLKFESLSAMVETLEIQRSNGGKKDKLPKGLCALIGKLVESDLEISRIAAWNKIKAAILSKPDKQLTIELTPGSTHVMKFDPATNTIYDYDDETGLTYPSKYSGGFKDHLTAAKKRYKDKNSRSK